MVWLMVFKPPVKSVLGQNVSLKSDLIVLHQLLNIPPGISIQVARELCTLSDQTACSLSPVRICAVALVKSPFHPSSSLSVALCVVILLV